MAAPQLSLAPSLLLTLGLLAVPLIIAAEQAAPDTWNNRLYYPLNRDEVNRHTPVHTEGTYLPPILATDTTYAAADSPLIVTGETTIPTGVRITLSPGVAVVAHEFARVTVDGTLIAAGTAEAPVTFTTNEIHGDNQNWSGLEVHRGGTAELAYVRIEYASPALSCLPGGTLAGTAVETNNGLVGFYTESADCGLVNSRLQALWYGIVARGVKPTVSSTKISAGRQNIMEFEN